MIIVDIDNTLADNSHRYKLATNFDGNINWDILYNYDNVISDKPIKYIIDTVKLNKECGRKIVIFTSRPERIRKATEHWLSKYDIPYDELYMRSIEDHYIKDVELKKKMYDLFVNEEVSFAIDDRQDIIELWEGLGIPTHKVNGI